MPSPIPPHDVQRALQALDVKQSDFDTIRRVPFTQAQTLLQELKAKARRSYKRLALDLHPDRTQGDEAKAQLFVLLGQVLGELDKVTVHPPPPPQPVQVINFTAVTVPIAHPSQPRVNRNRDLFQTMDASTWQAWQNQNFRSHDNKGFTPGQVTRIVKMRPR